MERGTERERQAVKEAWDAVEARRSRTDALLLGGVLVGTGFLLLSFAFLVPLELCVHGAGIEGSMCTTQGLSSTSVVVTLIAGSLMLGSGSHLIWQNS